MSENKVKLKFKWWYQAIVYLLLGYAIYDARNFIEHLLANPGFYLLLGFFLFLFFTMYRSQVTFDDEGIKRSILLLTYHIPYDNIEKVKVTKNRLKIYGTNENIISTILCLLISILQ